MTYAKTPFAGEITPEEQLYSPFVPDGTIPRASMMGGGMPQPQQAHFRALPQPMPYVPAMEGYGYAPPPGYKLVPLGSDEERPSKGRGGKAILAVVVVALLVIAIVYVANQRKKQKEKPSLTPAQAVKKLPTSRLAQNLYKRLENNGSTSKSVMAALDKIAKEQ